MTGLVLKLAPKERVLINGAVIENGDRRCRFSIVTPNANILRLKDAIHPEEATTPVRRVCYIAQLVLSGDADQGVGAHQLQNGISQIAQILVDEDSQFKLEAARKAANQGQFYQALKSLRGLLDVEDELLAAPTFRKAK